MKNRIFVLVALTAVLGAESAMAAKCKFKQDMDDFFTGALTLRTAWSLNSPVASAVSESGNQWLEVMVSFSKSSVFVPTQDALDSAFLVPQGASLEITLKDGTLVELPAIEGVKGTTNLVYPYEQGNDDYLTKVRAKIRYALTDQAIDALGRQNASQVRVHGDGQFRDITVPKKGLAQIKEAVKCLRQGGAK